MVPPHFTGPGPWTIPQIYVIEGKEERSRCSVKPYISQTTGPLGPVCYGLCPGDR